MRNGGRTVYLENQSGRYWDVDSLHFSGAAHLEVFDSNGSQLGEADLEGKIDETKRDVNKRIEVL